MAKIVKSGGSSESDQPTLREVRVEARREFTDAAVNKGADADGIARATNTCYSRGMGGKPDGGRDSWSSEDQKRITVVENIAANHIGASTQGGTQSECNDNVVDAAGRGADAAKEYIADKKEGGNWWGSNYGSIGDD